MTKILPIASGSKGNACLYMCGKTNILIDAGSNTKTIRNAIAKEGLALTDLTHILITHTHNDHISALPVLLKHTGAALYISKNALTEVLQYEERATAFEYGQEIDALGVSVRSFKTPHDSYGSVGFSVCNGKNKFTYCTDLGYITDEVKEAITGSHTLYIESNHDVNMLKKGGYPYFLKQRILSKNGHISNEECANIVADMAIKGSKNIILAHLSEENNRPDIALLQTETALYKIGADKDVSVMVATKINTQPPVVME